MWASLVSVPLCEISFLTTGPLSSAVFKVLNTLNQGGAFLRGPDFHFTSPQIRHLGAFMTSFGFIKADLSAK